MSAIWLPDVENFDSCFTSTPLTRNYMVFNRCDDIMFSTKAPILASLIQATDYY